MMQSITQPVLVFGQVEVHLDDLWVRDEADNREALTRTEARLLGRLAMEAGAPVEREVLLVDVWQVHPHTQTRTIDATVRRLRTKIERDPACPQHLLTVRGQGYRLVLGSRQEEDSHRDFAPWPLFSTDFVGRVDALSSLSAAMDSHQSVLLVGAPGMGKTRLAVAWAASRGELPGLYCDLGAARTVEAAVVCVARALNLPLLESAGFDDHPGIVARCLGRSGLRLLLLDTTGDLAGLAEVLALWMRRAPDLKLLLCARRAISLPGGVNQTVGPMNASDAVGLFLQRAGLQEGPFQSEAIEEIVRRLDRIPLALQLAADRVPLLGLDGVRQRLDTPLSLLGGDETSPGLRAALNTSWVTLSDDEQRVLACAAIFPGGFNAALLSGLLEALGEGLDWMRSLAELQALSLVQSRDPGVGSLYILEVVRHYALERGCELNFDVSPSSMLPQVVLAWAESWHQPTLASMTLIAQHHLLSQSEALHHALTLEDDLARTLRLTRVLEPVLAAMGPYTELVAVLGRAIQRSGGGLNADSAGLVVRRGFAYQQQGRLDHARTDAEAVLAWTEHEDAASVRLEAMTLLAGVARRQGQLVEAQACFEQALLWARSLKEGRLLARIWAGLGAVFVLANRFSEAMAAFENALGEPDRGWRVEATVQVDRGLLYRQLGRWDLAREQLRCGLALFESAGFHLDAARVKGNLGLVEIEAGDQALAERLLGEALVVFRGATDRSTEGQVLGRLALLYRRQARFFEAESCLRQALVAHRQVGNRRSEAVCESNLALLCIDRGRLQEALGHLEHAGLVYREQDDRRSEIIVLVNQASVNMELNRLDDAVERLRPLCAEAVSIGDRPLAGICWFNLGLAYHLKGTLEDARAAYGRAIHWACQAVEGLDAKMFGALVMLELGQREQALQWLSDVREALEVGKYPVRDSMLQMCEHRLSGGELAGEDWVEHESNSQDLRFVRRLVTV